MPREQKKGRRSDRLVRFPGARRVMNGQRMALQNSTRMTGQACRQAMSMNRAWFNLCSTVTMDLTSLPNRFTIAQLDYIDDMLRSFEETGREMGNLLLSAEEEVGDTFSEAGEEVLETAEETGHRMRQSEEQTARPKREPEELGNQRNERVRRHGAAAN